jgi:hypothetical protein
MVTLYHRTTPEAAIGILVYGFKDGQGTQEHDRGLPGVWVSDQPYGLPEADPETATLLALDFQGELDELRGNEWIFDGPGREWLLPAAFLNARCRVRVVQVAAPPRTPPGEK